MCIQDALRATFRLTTLVDKIFGGNCVNTVVCRECRNVSLDITIKKSNAFVLYNNFPKVRMYSNSTLLVYLCMYVANYVRCY